MGIISKEVITKLSNNTKKWYTSKGYIFTKQGDEIIVKVEDLHSGSSVKVECECDWCKKKSKIQYSDYKRSVKNSSTQNYLCTGCRIRETKIISKDILYYTHPHIAKMLKDKNDAFFWSFGTSNKICFICDVCGTEYFSRPYDVEHSKTKGCKNCSDGISYNNKFMYNLLFSLNVDFKSEYYNKNWCTVNYNNKKRKVRYDFLIEDKKIIIEMDGAWHKRDNTMSGQTKEESIIIDNLKDTLANSHGYKVIRIDCDENENTIFDKIKKQVLEKMSSYFDFSNVNWVDIDAKSRNSIYKKIWDLWNSSNDMSCKKIANIIKVHESTVCRALKIGNKLKILKTEYKTKDEKALEKREEIIELFQEGKSREEILISTGESYNVIIKSLKKGMKSNRIDYKTKDEKALEKRRIVIKNYNSGITSPEKISLIENIPKQEVYLILKKSRELGLLNYEYKTPFEQNEDKKKTLIKLFDNGEFDLKNLLEKSDYTNIDSIRKCLKKHYEKTKDIFYSITFDRYCYCFEEDTYYAIYYLAEKRKKEFPQKSIKEIYVLTRNSMADSISSNKTYLKKHWKIMSRQEAYFEARKNNKTLKERGGDFELKC